MKKLKINKKIIVVIIVGLVFFFGLFSFLNVVRVNAQDEAREMQYDPTTNNYTTPGGNTVSGGSGFGGWLAGEFSGFATWFFRLLGTVFISFGRFLLNAALGLFESVLKEGFNGRPEIAETGWKVCRDIANMFFILFMVVIAFATILRIEKYGVKELLPKLIGVALLINFSMVLCFVLIDFTNVAANYFITNAQKNANGTKIQLSAVFLDGLQITRTLTTVFCEQYLLDEENCATQFGENEQPTDIAICQNNAHDKFEQCDNAMQQIAEDEQENETLLHVIVSQLGSAAVLFIAAFIIFAGAFILIIRSVAIWFLVIISPLALVCFILPSLRKHWQNWLEQFTRWCLFAPAYAFFIWLAAKICTQGTIDRVASLQKNLFADRTAMVSQFFSDIKYIYNFIFVSAFLIGGLIVANKLGVAGASAAMSMGKKWTGTAKGWAKKQAMKPVKGTAQRIGAGTGMLRGGVVAGVGKFFGGKMGRRIEARGVQMKQSAAEQAYNKKYEAMLRTMSNEDVLKETETAMGSRKLIAARAAQGRGLMRDATSNQAQKAIGAYKKFGDADSARKLEELRPDAVSGKERGEAIQRAITNGTYKQWSKETYAGGDGQAIAKTLREQLLPGELVSLSKSWTKETREAFLDATQRDFSDTDWEKNSDNISARKTYHRLTNNTEKAFYSNSAGTKYEGPLAEEGSAADMAAKEAIPTTSAETMDKITPEESLKYVARHISAKQVETLGYGMQNAQAKGSIRKYIDKVIEEETEAIETINKRISEEKDEALRKQLETRKQHLETNLTERIDIREKMNKSAYWGGGSPTTGPAPSPGGRPRGGPSGGTGPSSNVVDLKSGTPEQNRRNAEEELKIRAQEHEDSQKTTEEAKEKTKPAEDKIKEGIPTGSESFTAPTTDAQKDDFVRKNLGKTVKIRRSSGDVDDGWYVAGLTPHGGVRVKKEINHRLVEKVVSTEELNELNK